MDITGAPQATATTTTTTENRAGWTITFAVLAVLITPFALLTSVGFLYPIGVTAGLVAVVLAALVVRRTRKGRTPRRWAWALLAFSLLPWVLTVAFFITISFFDHSTTPSP